jgi:Domain of unknown function (DUF5911)
VAGDAEDSMPLYALRDYALLADGERGAVVGPRGEIVWMCAPRWECDAVFATLVGGAGVYAVTPRDRFVWGGYYEEGSLIWRSRWVTDDGITECREALAFPGDPHRAVLVRQVIAGTGRAKVRVRLDPRAEFGRRSLRSLRHGRGWWAGRVGDLYLRWSGDVSGARVEPAGRGSQLLLDLTVPAGTSLDLMLEVADQPLERDLPDATAVWEATQAAWEQEVPRLDGVTATRDARHAYAVLRGLTSSSGGMVAAATTSLPERAATTTTGTPGSGTSATRGTRSRPRAPTRCSTGPWASWRTGCTRTARPWLPPTPPAAAGFRISAGWICPDTRAASTWSATGSTGSCSWTPSGSRCCCWRRPPGTAVWTRPGGGPPRSRRTR